MQKKIQVMYRLTEGEFAPPAIPELVSELPAILGITLPSDYLEFLLQHDGGEGFVGENYIVLWRAAELAEFNREYEVEKYAPGIFLFGSNGGGEGYGFDIESPATPIIRIPFIGMERRYATPVAHSFPDFFAQLSSS